MDTDQIEQTLRAHFEGALVKVQDSTGGGDHFEALVVSDRFCGESRIAQHKLVYNALGSSVGAEIHALALRTLTPEQWDRQNLAGGKTI